MRKDEVHKDFIIKEIQMRTRDITKFATQCSEEFVWQGNRVVLAIIPIKNIREHNINPVGRLDPNSTKFKALRNNLFGSPTIQGSRRSGIPTDPLYSFPILAGDGTIVDGHRRIKAHELEGISDIMCTVHKDIDPIKAYFRIQDKQTNCTHTVPEIVSCLVRGAKLEDLPVRFQNAYKKCVNFLGKNFVHKNIISEAKGTPSITAVSARLSRFSKDSWFGSTEQDLMKKVYKWFFEIKGNDEALRSMVKMSNGDKYTDKDRKLIKKSILNGERLVQDQYTKKFSSVPNNRPTSKDK